jgi:hypothetical protein
VIVLESTNLVMDLARFICGWKTVSVSRVFSGRWSTHPLPGSTERERRFLVDTAGPYIKKKKYKLDNLNRPRGNFSILLSKKGFQRLWDQRRDV